MTTTNRPAARRIAPAPAMPGGRFRLSPRMRKVVLVVHLAAAGAWLGLDLALGSLVLSALLSADDIGAGAAAASLAAIATWPLVVVGVVTLASGVVLGLGTRFGLVRYWWVLAKLAINVVLVTLVVVVLSPGVSRLGSTAREALASGAPTEVTAGLLFPPIVSSTAVIVAITVAVFKPWGRVGARR